MPPPLPKKGKISSSFKLKKGQTANKFKKGPLKCQKVLKKARKCEKEDFLVYVLLSTRTFSVSCMRDFFQSFDRLGDPGKSGVRQEEQIINKRLYIINLLNKINRVILHQT